MASPFMMRRFVVKNRDNSKEYALSVHPDVYFRCQEDRSFADLLLTRLETTYQVDATGKRTLTVMESLQTISDLGMLTSIVEHARNRGVAISKTTKFDSISQAAYSKDDDVSWDLLCSLGQLAPPDLSNPEKVRFIEILVASIPKDSAPSTPFDKPSPLRDLAPETQETVPDSAPSSPFDEQSPLRDLAPETQDKQDCWSDPLWQGCCALIMDEFMDDSDINNHSLMDSVNLLISGSNAALGAGLSKSRMMPARIEQYVEKIVPQYSDVTFKSHFRMTRTSFEELCSQIAPFLHHKTITIEKKVLSAMWVLCNKEAFRSTADRFGMSQGTLHLVFMDICSILTENQKQYIKWPNHDDLQHIAEGFERRCGFPGAIGAIDGTHIPIPGPKDHREAYINRKGFPSIQLQVVSDSKLQFLDVYAGWPGAVHDARVFRNSPLLQLLENQFLPSHMHLIGDSAYPLRTYIMVPFRDNGHLSVIEKKYNKAHSSTRVDVERAIGLLKCKFRRLKYLDMYLLGEIPSVIMASCVLHNFILQREMLLEDDIIEADGHVDNYGAQDVDHNDIPDTAQNKRNDIANNLA